MFMLLNHKTPVTYALKTQWCFQLSFVYVALQIIVCRESMLLWLCCQEAVGPGLSQSSSLVLLLFRDFSIRSLPWADLEILETLEKTVMGMN